MLHADVIILFLFKIHISFVCMEHILLGDKINFLVCIQFSTDKYLNESFAYILWRYIALYFCLFL